jgi:hypothetical protein
MAQLIIGNKPFGPHPFVCQIRDMKTHEPLEGIHVGDIGPKFGYNTMDNGFLLFNRMSMYFLRPISYCARYYLVSFLSNIANPRT